ncbi:MAG: serine/threonine-protein phosphatase [Chloroflexi bacterium]|nr:MAG: serine/threonine-protein phosphatase [Chloroflexota bacterium]
MVLRRLVYANAGHAPVIYCPAGGEAVLLEADAPAVGILPMSLSADHEMDFGVGDVLVVATDGFNEARNGQGEMLGYERLMVLVEKMADRSAEEIGAALFEEVWRFGNGRFQDDDQTLMVIKGVALDKEDVA